MNIKISKSVEYLIKGNNYKIIMEYDLYGNKIQETILNGKFIRMCFININTNTNKNTEKRETLYCPIFEYEETVNYLHCTRKVTHQRMIHPFNKIIRIGYDDEYK